MVYDWTPEEEADYEQVLRDLDKPNTAEIEAWLGDGQGEAFFDLTYNPEDFGEQPAGVSERMRRALRGLLRRLRNSPAQPRCE